VADVIVFGVSILFESIGLLVDGVVGQMHEEVVEVAAHGTFVVFGCKPGQSFFVNKTPQRGNSGDENVNSQVKLEVVD